MAIGRTVSAKEGFHPGDFLAVGRNRGLLEGVSGIKRFHDAVERCARFRFGRFLRAALDCRFAALLFWEQLARTANRKCEHGRNDPFRKAHVYRPFIPRATLEKDRLRRTPLQVERMSPRGCRMTVVMGGLPA